VTPVEAEVVVVVAVVAVAVVVEAEAAMVVAVVVGLGTVASVSLRAAVGAVFQQPYHPYLLVALAPAVEIT
jgi:hypothetical protein